MNMMEIISLAGTVCAILFGIAAYLSSHKKEGNDAGKESGALLTEIGYIKAGIDDIRKRQERQDENYIKLLDRISNVEQTSKDAQRRLLILEKNSNYI